MRYTGLTSGAVLANAGSYSRAAAMLLRGLLLKPRLRSSHGLVFRGRGVRVINPGFISTRGRLVLEDYVELQGVSQQGIRFGKDVSIGRGTMIRPSSYYGGPAGVGLRIGDRSSVAAGGFIGCSGDISIGNDVMIGPGCRLFSENHDFDDTTVPIKEQGVTRSHLRIEDDCWLASGVTVVAGVTIGKGSVIAAGSVVTHDIPAGSVAAGVPARVIRRRS